MQIKDRKCMAKGISVLLVLSIIFQTGFSAKATWIQESSKGDTETAWGLHTATFITRHGKIKANMPDDMAAGDTISGTVTAEPEGNTERDRIRNLDELNGFVVEMEKQKVPITEKVFKWGIPAALAGASAYLILRNKKGGEVARAQIPILNLPTDVERPSLPTSDDFHLPVIGQAGRPMQIEGPFDGNFSTTGIKINGRNAEVLAESPRKLVAQSPKDVVGPANIQLKEKEVEIEGGFRNLSLKLSAPKTKLARGQETTMNVEVGGLKGLQSEVPIILMNKTPNVVRMIGGDKQAILIVPESIRTSDTYAETIIIQGIIEGVFQIFAFVPVQATVGLTWHAVKEGMSVEAFIDFARLLREKYEQEKKNGTKRPDFVEKMINILIDCEGSTNDENLKMQKFILDKMLADEDVISTAAELINTALSPYTPKKQAKAAGKLMLKVAIDQIKRKKQREKLQKAFKELEEMEKRANEEKDESKKNEINKKIEEKLDEIRRLLIQRWF